MSEQGQPAGGVSVDFCGEIYPADPTRPLTIGREGDVEIDDNPFLHRSFLQITHEGGFWWLTNVGSTLTATVADKKGLLQAWLSPGARIPLAFERVTVWFTAGPTTYDFDVVADTPSFQMVDNEALEPDATGETTVGRVSFTPDQKLLLIALCEDFLRRDTAGTGAIPSSADAARRLGWTVTKFNRKLDNVCDKLTRAGVRGLRGSERDLAVNRRMVLVEYAVSTLLITPDDLPMLAAGEAHAEDRIVR